MVSVNVACRYTYRFSVIGGMQNVLKHIVALMLFICPSVVGEASQRPLILLLLGAPGSGRDALAVKVSSSLSMPYVSAADLLLDYSDDDNEMGRMTRECLNTGHIPDELLLRLIAERTKRPDCRKGFLLDGFPKTAEQAKALKVRFSQEYRMLPVYIRTSDKWLLTCHEGRLVCTNCGRVYHLDRSPPQDEGVCDVCSQKLTRRSDDCPETLKKRTEHFRDTILPLQSYFSVEKMLVEIDGDRPFEDMFLDIKTLINTQKG